MNWRGKRVAIIGLGREGKALARYLAGKGAPVTVSDRKPAEALEEARRELAGLPIRYLLGGHPAELLESEAIFVSPGVPQDLPILREARARGIALESLTRLFFGLCPAQVIGITGSSGKGTTASLTGRMFEAAGHTIWLGGNIGRPLLEEVDAIAPDHWVVLELSSFQLETLEASPQLAAILNITPDHLDRHASLAEYISAKAHIFRLQKPSDWTVLGWEDERAWSLAAEVRGRLAGFGLEDRGGNGSFLRRGEMVVRLEGAEEVICPAKELKLPGVHNLRNALAAALLARIAGVDGGAIERAIAGFRGLPHRLQLVRRLGGVRYYDDSIATSPTRAMAALNAFSEPIVLLAGGREKNLPLGELASLIRRKVRLLILMGEAAGELERAVRAAEGEEGLPEMFRAKDLSEAVGEARRRSLPGEVLLLSPAFTSFDMYRDYAERGEHFQRLVRELK